MKRNLLLIFAVIMTGCTSIPGFGESAEDNNSVATTTLELPTTVAEAPTSSEQPSDDFDQQRQRELEIIVDVVCEEGYYLDPGPDGTWRDCHPDSHITTLYLAGTHLVTLPFSGWDVVGAPYQVLPVVNRVADRSYGYLSGVDLLYPCDMADASTIKDGTSHEDIDFYHPQTSELLDRLLGLEVVEDVIFIPQESENITFLNVVFHPEAVAFDPQLPTMQNLGIAEVYDAASTLAVCDGFVNPQPGIEA